MAGTMVHGTAPSVTRRSCSRLPVVRVAFNTIEPDDREQHVVTDTDSLLGGEKVLRSGAEVRYCLVPVGRRVARGVDHHRDAGQRGVEAGPRQSGGSKGPDVPGRTGNGRYAWSHAW
jgi:hypothetical protein